MGCFPLADDNQGPAKAVWTSPRAASRSSSEKGHLAGTRRRWRKRCTGKAQATLEIDLTPRPGGSATSDEPESRGQVQQARWLRNSPQKTKTHGTTRPGLALWRTWLVWSYTPSRMTFFPRETTSRPPTFGSSAIVVRGPGYDPGDAEMNQSALPLTFELALPIAPAAAPPPILRRST